MYFKNFQTVDARKRSRTQTEPTNEYFPQRALPRKRNNDDLVNRYSSSVSIDPIGFHQQQVRRQQEGYRGKEIKRTKIVANDNKVLKI
jgi:hypothetical protein